jgi:hypothetical protein
MSTPTDLSVLLRLYTGKQNSPTIIIHDFCDYLQKYARHYLQEAPELQMYLEDTQATVLKELEALAEDSKVFLSTDLKSRKLVFVPQFYVDRMVLRFREIDERIEIPFPILNELPQSFPPSYLRQIYMASDFEGMIEDTERNGSILIQLIFPDDTPAMIYPGSVSPEKLLELSMSKIRLFLRKDESKDYIQKRMMLANPGRELSIKNHLVQFQTRPPEALGALRHAGEAYQFWSCLCSFIRQDFSKKNEKTPEDISLLQAVYITELMNNFYKNRAQQNLQRETALKNLELCFQKSPFFYDLEAISRFVDTRGVPLLGQYENEDLQAFIREKTADGEMNSLPELLVFRSQSENRYFVLKEKIIPLIVRLCNEGRKNIKETLTREWFQLLSGYRHDNAMSSQADFEKKLDVLCQSTSPILHAVMNASFIPLLALEDTGTEKDNLNGFRIFDRGRLLPWSTLLMLDRQELLTDTRIMLPFWYTFPVISTIIAFFKKPKKTRKAARKAAVVERKEEEIPAPESGQESREKRKKELVHAVGLVEKRLIPEGSDLDAELGAQLERWNRTLSPEGKQNLTEDVNSLIRDYIRRVSRTLKAQTFDLARVQNLSDTLAETPNLMKIKNREALRLYIQLYILKLVKSIS